MPLCHIPNLCTLSLSTRSGKSLTASALMLCMLPGMRCSAGAQNEAHYEEMLARQFLAEESNAEVSAVPSTMALKASYLDRSLRMKQQAGIEHGDPIERTTTSQQDSLSTPVPGLYHPDRIAPRIFVGRLAGWAREGAQAMLVFFESAGKNILAKRWKGRENVLDGGEDERNEGDAIISNTHEGLNPDERTNGKQGQQEADEPLRFVFLGVSNLAGFTHVDGYPTVIAYPALRRFTAAVYYPWDLGMCFFNELYSIGVPLFVPSVNYATGIIWKMLQHTDYGWWQARKLHFGEVPGRRLPTLAKYENIVVAHDQPVISTSLYSGESTSPATRSLGSTLAQAEDAEATKLSNDKVRRKVQQIEPQLLHPSASGRVPLLVTPSDQDTFALCEGDGGQEVKQDFCHEDKQHYPDDGIIWSDKYFDEKPAVQMDRISETYPTTRSPQDEEGDGISESGTTFSSSRRRMTSLSSSTSEAANTTTTLEGRYFVPNREDRQIIAKRVAAHRRNKRLKAHQQNIVIDLRTAAGSTKATVPASGTSAERGEDDYVSTTIPALDVDRDPVDSLWWDENTPFEDIAFWWRHTDFALWPAVGHFESIPALMHQVNTADFDRISLEMRRWNAKTLRWSTHLYRKLVNNLILTPAESESAQHQRSSHASTPNEDDWDRHCYV
ncbi:unnamed protein product [Amoebophrya sp. A25]|nr:unnamed protein product [Amoebophrya sp. A25]|eukprot:GSA25T00005789001.1